MNAAPKTLRHLSELTDAGLAPASRRAALEQVAAQYAVAITPAMAELIDPSDPHDPIARQFVPDAAELETQPQERADPIGDHAHSPVDGVVHRYPDRALLKLTATCAVYCRFCFRREMVGPGAESAVAAAARRRARLHRRSPGNLGGHPDRRRPAGAVAAPAQAGDDAACRDRPCQGRPRPHPHSGRRAVARHAGAGRRRCEASGKATYVVLHANHARELTPAAREACALLIDAGIPMLSQSVLLAGVNDDAATLGALMRALVECRIKPYYLHHADLAPGTSHLRTSIERGQELMRALRGRYSGLCQPGTCSIFRAVTASRRSGRAICREDGPGRYCVEDFNGGLHSYPPRP